MPFVVRAIAFSFLFVAQFSIVASADDGPRPTVGQLVELPRPRQELIVLVSGFGSDAYDGTFAELLERYAGDPRFKVIRFGQDDDHPYDTVGSIEANGRELLDQVRDVQLRHRGVHLVTHSMGGAVADRAIAGGLSASDGLKTYIALASPHAGSFGADLSQAFLLATGESTTDVCALADELGVALCSDAMRELASLDPLAVAPDHVTRLNLRLASDAVVTVLDDRSAGVETRSFMPMSSEGLLDGHGAVLRDPRVLSATEQIIETRAIPADTRSPVEKVASTLVQVGVVGVVGVAGVLTAAGVLALRFRDELELLARALRAARAAGKLPGR